ncbi:MULTISPECIES: hypothetical protein [Marinobacter]|uniref:Uncharacterized protein n=1 Tax=Marinobacter nauticus (strain ATCC 700491 / DSM 11845 / VT8) TaxID=351348 RepID=A1U833_MARN8|nr:MULTISPECIES: hypothetical protein [Marinobacter]ABM21152.1 hypothetical protein Maqu_4301 [Marinobacter nauticus VT8]|tara:strand:- start:1074 stop:1382 length:309 start_codon:yes stop_codon:yes gene_type:complete
MEQHTQTIATKDRVITRDFVGGALYGILLVGMFAGAIAMLTLPAVAPYSTLATCSLIALAPLTYIIPHYWQRQCLANLINVTALIGSAVLQGITILQTANVL